MMAGLGGLNHLLKASSKSLVEKCLNLTFVCRSEPLNVGAEAVASILELSVEEGQQLFAALLRCVLTTIENCNIEDLADLLGDNEAAGVDPKLKKLIGQGISAKLDAWREALGSGRIGYPRLVEVDWDLHIKRASSQVRNMMVPAVVLSLQVEDQPRRVGAMPGTTTIPLELSAGALDTLHEGMNKIKEQLQSMGK